MPNVLSRSVNSSGGQLKSTYCLGQLRLTFISKFLLGKLNSVWMQPNRKEEVRRSSQFVWCRSLCKIRHPYDQKVSGKVFLRVQPFHEPLDGRALGVRFHLMTG